MSTHQSDASEIKKSTVEAVTAASTLRDDVVDEEYETFSRLLS
jgi:hypothetical protein